MYECECLPCMSSLSCMPCACSVSDFRPLFRVRLRRLWLSVRCSASGFVGSGCQSVVRPLFCVGLRRLWLSFRCSVSGSMCVRKFVLGVYNFNINLTYFLCVHKNALMLIHIHLQIMGRQCIERKKIKRKYQKKKRLALK